MFSRRRRGAGGGELVQSGEAKGGVGGVNWATRILRFLSGTTRGDNFTAAGNK